MPSPASFAFGDTTVLFPRDASGGRIGLELVPTALLNRRASRRETLQGEPYIDGVPGLEAIPAFTLDSLAEVKLGGDAESGGFAGGHTQRRSASNARFRFDSQRVAEEDGTTIIVTTSKSDEGLRLEHRLRWREGEQAGEIVTTFFNDSDQAVTLEMLTSFLLGGLTAFDPADAPERLHVHRFRSAWSAEGRLESRRLEELHLERSWIGHAKLSERFGQVGSLPVRRWFPFVAVEDKEAGVCWGAQLAWAGSWQMEVFRQDDGVSLSGGLADREFGHWTKRIAPGEALEAPPARIACVQGGLDALCERLTGMQRRDADRHPAVERDLPIVFNEYCTTWGDPRHDKVVRIADRLRGTDVSYLVIDAGWYKSGTAQWSNGHGDWVPSPELFPEGIEATAREIRNRGLIPGLWFEIETCGSSSAAFSLADRLLHRDGAPLTAGERRFWDLNDPEAVAYLTDRVIGLLERGGFGYLKVDYNETIGLGCDDPDSLGEGLRKQVHGIYRFFDLIRERLPDLVIENCSSGGHRLEPSMLGRTAMSSFSDAHELSEIPVIAASLHRLMLPRQSQIWAVLHPGDSDRRLVYSLAATFLGRMCLSGDIEDLSPAQWSRTEEAMRLYRQAAPLIRDGSSRLYGETGHSWRHPRGWQACLRVSPAGDQILAIFHGFAEAPKEIALPLPDGAWRIERTLMEREAAARLNGSSLSLSVPGDFSASVLLLERTNPASS